VRGQLGQLAQTVAAVNEAIRLAPHRAEYYGYQAQLFYAQQRYPETIRWAETGLHIDPEQPNCLLWRALAQEAVDQPGAADQDFARLLSVAPASAVVHRRLGELLLNRGELAAAVPHLAEALRQAPHQAPQLLPLLRQARKHTTYPSWLQRAMRRETNARAVGAKAGFWSVLVRMALVVHAVINAWFPRPAPLFPILDPPPLVRPWAARPLAWLVLMLLLALLVYCNAMLQLRAGPGIFMMAFFALRYFLKS
jgi:tetratricopeptide (TPR) repeat protein